MTLIFGSIPWAAIATPEINPPPPIGTTIASRSGTSSSNSKPAAKPRKLSYKEQRELDGLPEHIAALEAEQKQVQAELADPKLYASDTAKAVQLHARDQAIESELMQALERWELLSS